MKIPFTLEAWLKDKSKRVETRDGRIVHDVWEVKNAVTAKEYRTEVCALIEGEEDALVFFKNGKYLPVNAESPYVLFIDTPEEELSEFEKGLVKFYRTRGEIQPDKDGVFNRHEVDELLHKAASELLAIARAELVKQGYVIEKKAFHDAVEKIDDKHKAEMSVEYSLHCKIENGTRHAVMNWNEFQKVAKHFINYGKAEALEDLPKWKKCGEYTLRTYGEEHFEYRGDGHYLVAKGMEILLSDIEKLPRFKED